MNTKTHFFDIDLAEKYGINEAIILTNLKYWIEHNIANNKNFYDGEYWTYNSIKAFKELFPYLSEKQIRYSLKKLEDLKIIKTGNYNKLKYDRTTWYAIIDKSILQYGNIHLTKGINGNIQKVKMEVNKMDTPIPDINSNINTNIKQDRNLYISEVETSQGKGTNEISQIIELFKEINPALNYGNKTQRKACEDMIRKFGFKEVMRMTKQVIAIQGMQYAPRATTPYLMYQKLGDFMIYFKSKQGNNKILDLTK